MTPYRILTPLLVAVSLLAASCAYARSGAYDRVTSAEDLMSVDVAGDPTREVTVQLYTIPPGTKLPWHTHPGAQEIAYVLHGRLDIELKGEPIAHLKTGDHFYVPPDRVHRGINPSDAEPVKLYVVRIKPKGEATTKEFDAEP